MESARRASNSTAVEPNRKNFEFVSGPLETVIIKEENYSSADEDSNTNDHDKQEVKSEGESDDDDHLSQSDLEKEFEEEEKSSPASGANDTTSYKCQSCSEVFEAFVDFRLHRKRHFIEKRTCQLCQTVCQSISKLETHMNGHLGLKPFKCDDCDRTFVSRNHMKLHMRTHSKEKRYTCVKCGKAFRYLGSLRSHVATHNDVKLEEIKCKTNGDVSKKMARKRNAWSNEEVSFFISMLVDKKHKGLWDGKKFSSTQVFDSLEKPMREAGYKRDARQLVTKFKNMKFEYAKAKRNNLIYPFFDEEMGRLLAENGGEIVDTKAEDTVVMDFAGSSKESDVSVSSPPLAPITRKYQSTSENKANESGAVAKFLSTQKEILELLKNPPEESDDRFLNKYFDRQEKMLTNFTNHLLDGFREIFAETRDSSKN